MVPQMLLSRFDFCHSWIAKRTMTSILVRDDVIVKHGFALSQRVLVFRDINGTPYQMSISEDYQKPVGSRAEMKRATSMKLIHKSGKGTQGQYTL